MQHEGLEDNTISLQCLLQGRPPPLEALLRLALNTFHWDHEKLHFNALLSSQDKLQLHSYFGKVLQCASEANMDIVMDEVAQHASGGDQIMTTSPSTTCLPIKYNLPLDPWQ